MALPMPTITKREQMGAVCVRVQLSNAIDVEMVEHGLIEAGRVHSCSILALVDTGATKSIIPPTIIKTN